MSDELNKMNEENTPVEKEAQGSDFDKRRKLLKGVGVTAATSMLSIASNPVMARGVCSPSGFVSAINDKVSGVRRHASEDIGCGGLSHGYWKNHDWPEGVNKDDSFNETFKCTLSDDWTGTLMETLITGQNSNHGGKLRENVTNTYLNALDGWSQSTFSGAKLTTNEVKQLWCGTHPFQSTDKGAFLLDRTEGGNLRMFFEQTIHQGNYTLDSDGNFVFDPTATLDD